MATQRIVIDPITRIEGHLRIELETDGGRITNAWASATQYRGIETILQGHDPRDAWALAQRICGVCTGVHAIASIRAVEDALKYPIPKVSGTDPQSRHGHGYRAGSRDALLPPPRPRLGGREIRPVGRPPGNGPAGGRHFALAEQFANLVQGSPATGGEVGVRGAARHIRRRLLGPPGLPSPAGGEPARPGPLPGRAPVAAGNHPAPRHLRREESPSEFPRRRDGLRHQPRQPAHHQRRATR